MRFDELEIAVYTSIHPDEVADWQARATEAGAQHFFRKNDNEGLINWYETLTGKTVVLIEDNPGQRELQADLLESRGATVHSFSSGEAVLKEVTADTLEFDTLLTDVELDPGMNGLLFLVILRQLLDQQN